MKKIFILLAIVCGVVACDPVQEDISMGGNITVEQLREMTTVTLDKAASGKNGNVLICETHAPVSAAWNAGGKNLGGNYLWKKLKLGEQTITLTALCGDGTILKTDYPVNVEEITNPLEKIYIYDGEPFTVVASGDAGETRFSDNEGKHWPFIKDDVYWGGKTLIFEILEANAGPAIWGMPDGPAKLRIMTGWWDPVFADGVEIPEGLWELPITQEIAEACASKKSDGQGKDLNLLVTTGSVKFGKIYYEE